MSLKHVILTLINHTPSTGYEINKMFDQKIGYFWHASHQQVYPELAKLKQSNLLECEHIHQQDKPDRKLYSITVRGQEELKKWLHQPLPKKKYKDALLVRLLTTDLVPPDVLCQQISEDAQNTQKSLDEFMGIQETCYSIGQREKLSAFDKRLYINMRKGMLLAEAELAWAKESINLLLME
jgi:PadR family transcriptional regulator AphA